MVFYKDKDGEKILDYTQCDTCKAICNKFSSKGSIHITLPLSHPVLSIISEEEMLKGKDFCSHNCAILFLEECQKEMFKINISKIIGDKG